MRKLSLVAVILMAFSAFASAQTADEIIDRMNKEMDKGDAEGFSMIFEMRFPILGQMSTLMKLLGDYSRSEVEIKGEKNIMWMVKDTSWTYTPKSNEIVIEYVKRSGDSSNNQQDMVRDVAKGYDVKLVGETADTWQIRCDKSKSNKVKDDPKRMDLVVSKANYLPVSMIAKAKGVTITIRDYSLGVKKAEVTFDPSAYPGVTITDKRQ